MGGNAEWGRVGRVMGGSGEPKRSESLMEEWEIWLRLTKEAITGSLAPLADPLNPKKRLKRGYHAKYYLELIKRHIGRST